MRLRIPGPTAACVLVVLVTSYFVSGLSAFADVPGGSRAGTGECRGREAVVVAPGADFVGTPGPDVVIAQAGADIRLGDGDDLVCVRTADFASLYLGAGEDIVDVLDDSDYGTIRTKLGPGDDTYLGGPGSDLVYSYDQSTGLAGAGKDHISTGAGRDGAQLLEGSSSEPLDVDLDLGPGSDTLLLGLSPLTPGSVLHGGTGADKVQLDATTDRTVRVDAGLGTVDAGTRLVSAWTSFESVRIEQTNFSSTLEVVGSDRADHVVLGRAYGTTTVDLGAGRDRLTVEYGAQGTARGGDGRDLFELRDVSAPVGTPTVDLRSGRVGNLRIASFQDATSNGRSIVGNRQDNHLTTACGVVTGLAGNDRIRRVPGNSAPCRYRAYGGRGNDVLTGSKLQERLVGGPGFDVARGGAGRDSCAAERRRSC